MRGPQSALLPDRRLHLQHGPIDLIIEANGKASEIHSAYSSATVRFRTILDELCSELSQLKAPAGSLAPTPSGKVARRMAAAVGPFGGERFITPMAAVAGAVAEEVLEAMMMGTSLDRAYVNNGGDIALHLSDEFRFTVALVADPEQPVPYGKAELFAGDAVRGVATSGRIGRSFSLGIADAVTILARSASEADAAATIVANAVDLPGHAAVGREPASLFDPQSDLGDRLVTVRLGRLSTRECDEALANGLAMAQHLVDRGLIEAAALHLRGRSMVASRGHALERRLNLSEKTLVHA